MPLRFKRSLRKVGGRRRVVRRPTTATRRYMKSRRQPIAGNRRGHFFKRCLYRRDFATITPATDQYGSITFALSDLPTYTEFTNLYDSYKINKVQVTFYPRLDSADYSSQQQMPMLHTLIDHNDANPISVLSGMMESEFVKTTRGTQIHTRYFSPKVQTRVYESLGNDGFTTSRINPWINTDDPNVPHYCLKWYCQKIDTGGDAQIKIDMRIKYYFQCRELK